LTDQDKVDPQPACIMDVLNVDYDLNSPKS